MTANIGECRYKSDYSASAIGSLKLCGHVFDTAGLLLVAKRPNIDVGSFVLGRLYVWPEIATTAGDNGPIFGFVRSTGSHHGRQA